MNTTVSNISDMIANGQEDIMESYVQTFSCKKTSDDGALLGYYALTHKAMTVSADGLSRQFKDKVKRFSALDGDTNAYTVSAYLIAQIGKNYGVDNGERISDNDGRRYLQYMCFL